MKRTNRCKECGKVIREHNKSKLCCGCSAKFFNMLKKQKREMRLFNKESLKHLKWNLMKSGLTKEEAQKRIKDMIEISRINHKIQEKKEFMVNKWKKMIML